MQPESTPQKIVQVKVTLLLAEDLAMVQRDRRAAIAAQRSQTHTSRCGRFPITSQRPC